MAKNNDIQFWQGLEADRLAQIPAQGEPLWTTDAKKLYVGDGVTAGGILTGMSFISTPIVKTVAPKVGRVAADFSNFDDAMTWAVQQVCVDEGHITLALKDGVHVVGHETKIYDVNDWGDDLYTVNSGRIHIASKTAEAAKIAGTSIDNSLVRLGVDSSEANTIYATWFGINGGGQLFITDITLDTRADGWSTTLFGGRNNSVITHFTGTTYIFNCVIANFYSGGSASNEGLEFKGVDFKNVGSGLAPGAIDEYGYCISSFDGAHILSRNSTFDTNCDTNKNYNIPLNEMQFNGGLITDETGISVKGIGKTPTTSIESADFTVDTTKGFDHYYDIDTAAITVTVPTGLPLHHRFTLNAKADTVFSAATGVTVNVPDGDTFVPKRDGSVVHSAIVAADTLAVHGDLAPYVPPPPMITTWRTASASEPITLPINNFNTDIDIDWGDGSTIENHTGTTPPTHTYATAGDYDVSVSGTCPIWDFRGVSISKDKIIEIKQWKIKEIGLTSCANMFYSCSNLATISATDNDSFSDIKNFSKAWFECSALTSFPLIDTSKGTDFSNTWNACSALTSFPLIDTSSGIVFLYAWYKCSALTSFPLIDTSSGINFSRAWYICSALTSFPLIDTSKGTDFSNAWSSCTKLTAFPLLVTSKGTDFSGAWNNCSTLTAFPHIDTSSGIKFRETWCDCSALTAFPLLVTSKGTNFLGAWRRCTKLTSFPLIDTSKGTDFSNAWQNCTTLTAFPHIDTSSGIKFESTWYGCQGLTLFPLIDMSNGTNFSFAWNMCTSLTAFPLIDTSKGTDFSGTWRNCTKLTCLSKVDTRNATMVTTMFYGCWILAAPNTTEQGQIAATPGIEWINSNPCP